MERRAGPEKRKGVPALLFYKKWEVMSTLDDLKIGAAYVRVSTSDQLEYSPDSQIKLIQDYAKREGYIIPEEYIYREDDGISGKSADKRPAFRLMIATAKEANPPFECIFVWKFSRFARNQEESIMYKNLLRKRGIEVRSISEPIIDSPFSSLIERIIEWMDEFYLINLASEVRRGMKEKASRGEAMGRPPFGYDVKGKKLIPNDNASTVKYIFELYEAGHSFRDIAATLNNSGIKTARGNVFDSYSVRYILQNPAYIGKLRWTEEDHAVYRSPQYNPTQQELPDGQHEAIVPKTLWDTVQTKLAAPGGGIKYIRAKNGKTNIYTLKGLVRCSSCGATLTQISRGSHRAAALQCYRYSRGQCKVSHCITLERAENAVIAAMEEAAMSKEFAFSPKKPQEPRLTRDWNKLITAEQNRLERARTALLDGVFTSDEYRRIKETVQENMDKLLAAKEREESLAPSTPNPDDFAEKVLTVVKLLKDQTAKAEDKNKALRSIIERIIYNKSENSFDIYFLF